MKLTPNAERLQALLEQRAGHEIEIARVEKLGADSEAEKTSLLNSPGALDDEATGASLARLQTKATLAPLKAQQLRGELTKLDAEIGELATVCIGEAWAVVDTVEKSRFEKFCTALEQFFSAGRAAKFFNRNPHVPSVPFAKEVFDRTDTKSQLDLLRQRLGGAHPQHVSDPLRRANCLLKEIPTIPSA